MARMLVKLSLLIVAAGIAAFVIFLLVDLAYVAWGVLGALAAVVAVLLLYAWIHDRRAQRRYEDA